MKKTLKIIVSVVLMSVIFLVAANFIKVSSNESLLYKIQQYVTYSKADWENYERNQKLLAENPVPASYVTEAVQTAQQEDIYPVDTNFATPAVKSLEMERIKKAKFENLVVAKIKPDDEDAQAALIRFTKDRLTDIIIRQKLNIKVGKCYVNSNTEGNFNCVSCMILLYNRDKKTGRKLRMEKISLGILTIFIRLQKAQDGRQKIFLCKFLLTMHCVRNTVPSNI